MSLRRVLVVLSLPLGVVLALYGCVGDSSISGASDSGADGPANADAGSPDASGMVGMDAGTDAGNGDSGNTGPVCVYVTDAGAPGSLDQSFSNTTHTEAISIVDGDVDSQGNIYVLGAVQNCLSGTSDYDFAVFKYGPTGAPVASFGTNGRFCVGVPVTASVGSERPYGLRVDPTGNVVVAGTTGNGGFNPVQIVVARILATGGIDPNFGASGVYTAPIATLTYPVAYSIGFDTSVSPAKVLVAGADGDPFKANVGGFVLRLTSLGTVDNGFNNGSPIVDSAATGYYGIAADSTGHVYATGSAKPQRDLIVSKWTQGGVADAFGTAGKVTLSQVSTDSGVGPTFSEGRSVVPLSSGKLIIGGLQDAEEGPAFVAQLTAAGALDSTFAAVGTPAGALRLSGLTFNSDYEFSALRRRCDGRYLAMGYDKPTGTMAAARVSTSGTLEAFGDAGLAISTGPGSLGIAAVEDATTGRIVLIGRNAAGQLVLERYNP